MILVQDQNELKIYVHKYAYAQVEAFFLSCQQALQGPKIPICLQTSLVNEDHIVYNTEQLTRETCLRMAVHLVQNHNVKQFWDQSQMNLEILKKALPERYHSKLAWHPVSVRVPDLYQDWRRAFKDFDLAFVGTVTPRRKRILQTLSDRGISIHVIQSFGFHETIRECLGSRAILNVHADDDYQIFETARCSVWLDSDVPVLSETSLDNDSRVFVFDVRDNFVDTVFEKVLELRGLLWRTREME